MTARQISELIRHEDSSEKQAYARSKVSKALNRLKEYDMVKIVGAQEERPHGRLWGLTKE